MAALIDPTVDGRYPVILGDGLLGKTSNDIFTGIRYNHKPALSSDDAPNSARLKPSSPGKTDSYDLSYIYDDGQYAFTGSRNTNSDQYVLHFDPERKAFILDKLDSTFNMNVTRLPGNSDPARLRRQFPHLDSQQPAVKRAPAKKTSAPKDNTATKSSAPSKAHAKPQAKEPRRKTERKQQAKEVALSFPEADKPKPKTKSNPTSTPTKTQKSLGNVDDEDEEDEDDDGGLLVEFPGTETAKQADFSPAFPPPRRFDDFMDQRDSEADDADGESDVDPDLDFQLPSPVNQHAPRQEGFAENTPPERMQQVDEDDNEDENENENENEAGDDAMDDMEDDLARAFEDMAGDESEISEED